MGSLTLIPTPIDDHSPLCVVATKKLKQAVIDEDMIIVEEHKIARRRWLQYGLPREAIDHFYVYNEHTYNDVSKEVLSKLKKGKNAFLMSDCGLPAFCDPGRQLIDFCHSNHIKVTSTPFANSISLAVALSGFEHDRFVFEGFVPAKGDLRSKELKRIVKAKEMSILMDTPYRINKLVDELAQLAPGREAFLGMDLNMPEELLLRGTLGILSKILPPSKREFILILRKLNRE